MQEKFVRILNDLLYSLPESDTCNWCGLKRCNPTCVRVRAITILNKLCPICGNETFPRKGFHFDHERRCSKCDWVGEIR